MTDTQRVQVLECPAPSSKVMGTFHNPTSDRTVGLKLNYIRPEL